MYCLSRTDDSKEFLLHYFFCYWNFLKLVLVYVDLIEGALEDCFLLKGRVMGPLLVLVCPCLRENVFVTCKIVSFLCSLDDFLQKNVIVFFFGNQISEWRSFEKVLFFTYFSQFLVTREKTQKFLQHISHLHTYTHIFCSPIDFICLTNFAKITNLSCMVSLWCNSWC